MVANATLDMVRQLACGIVSALQEGDVPDQDTLESLADDAARAAELLEQFLAVPQSEASGPCHACGNHVADTMGRCEHCDYDGNAGRFAPDPESWAFNPPDRVGE